ncbi:dihydroxyacetone kinase phosphoryl donor subunit DhaM [Nocardia huaxiensis]|uniref:Phosphocarrier protein HPr n=1 Tax=Nocardia huaxiensis TaxID=2755382 RepID=A0A7D6VET7_9NOCA|nr:dihydroxyacetone kinase phosphoryl donor subunit DhaM [Nocardia huaxiensis]QLY30955.1 HPr family phosphocarrier protein [Nocardia huaxiensis]UFS94471.1 HPr family phosphocarrier protein [Nocardia huaxiensis]
MIGLVVVSHSRALATAAVDLATALLPNPQARIVIAAGLSETAYGTDAVAVATAIKAADSGDGVLILMDLGSAVLSAETALDLLDSPHRVRLCGAPLVEGLVAALAAADGGADLDKAAHEADRALDGKRAQLGEPPTPPREEQSNDATTPMRATVTVTNEHGLHARPAAELVSALRDLDADIQLRNATTGTGPVPGDSLTRVLTLGVLPGHQLEISADGPDSATAMERIRAVVSSP